MDDYEYEWERREILSQLPGYDPSFKILHHDSWSTYEENGWMFVFEKDGLYWLLEYSYSVFAEDNTPRWEPYVVTADSALEAMQEWEETGADLQRQMS